MAMERQSFETMEGHSSPTVRQVSVFLDNRVGQLFRLTQVLDQGNIRILGLSVMNTVDCAIVRMIFDAPDRALPLLKKAKFPVSVTEIIVVKVPKGKRGMMAIWSVLLSSEVNVSYAYPLLPAQVGPALVLSVDSIEIAIDTLQREKLEVLGEADLL